MNSLQTEVRVILTRSYPAVLRERFAGKKLTDLQELWRLTTVEQWFTEGLAEHFITELDGWRSLKGYAFLAPDPANPTQLRINAADSAQVVIDVTSPPNLDRVRPNAAETDGHGVIGDSLPHANTLSLDHFACVLIPCESHVESKFDEIVCEKISDAGRRIHETLNAKAKKVHFQPIVGWFWSERDSADIDPSHFGLLQVLLRRKAYSNNWTVLPSPSPCGLRKRLPRVAVL